MGHIDTKFGKTRINVQQTLRKKIICNYRLQNGGILSLPQCIWREGGELLLVYKFVYNWSDHPIRR